MKTTRFFVLFVAAATMMLASCDKENNTADNQDSQTEKMIIGSWTETEAIYIFIQNGISDTSSLLEDGETSEITFKADKTYHSVYHSFDGDSESNGTWAVSGNKFTFSDEFGPMIYTIDQLDATVFNISIREEGEDEDGPFSYYNIIRMTKNQ